MGLKNEHHEATEGLVRLLTKVNHDLTVVQHRLDKEFQQIYPENANPIKLISRIKKIKHDFVHCGTLSHSLPLYISDPE